MCAPHYCERLIKDVMSHWARSYQRVADRVSSKLTKRWLVKHFAPARHITIVDTKEKVYQIFAVLDRSAALSIVLSYISLSKEGISVVQIECN